jgi:hypothetical protein
MNLIIRAAGAIVIFCSFAPPLQAAEGFLMVEKSVTGTTTRTTQVQLERDRLRAEMSGTTGGTQIVVFDGPQQVLRIISVDRKSYTELTKADADRMAAQANAVRAAMKEKIAKLPPEQREKSEAMMALLSGAMPGAGVKPEFRRAGNDKVGKWTCDKYEGFRNDVKVIDVCTVDPKTLGLTAADFEISKQVSSFFRTLLPQAENQLVGIATLETQGFAGIPVRRITYNAGKVASTSEVTDVRRENFAASSYEVPAGFQKQAVGVKPPPK